MCLFHKGMIYLVELKIRGGGGKKLWLLHFHIQYEYQKVKVVLWWLLLIDKNWWTKASPEISKCLKCEFLGWGPPPMLKPTVCMGSRQKCNQRYLVIYDSNIITTSESDVLLNFSCLICTTECFGLIFLNFICITKHIKLPYLAFTICTG